MSDPTTLPPPTAADVRARSGARDASPAPAVPGDGTRGRALRWLRDARGRSRRLLTGVASRRRSVDGVIAGCLLTLLVIAVDAAGWLAPLEFLLYDARAAAFQAFLPKPADTLVHLDIDEGALEAIAATENERFPWPRSILAEMLDEVAMANPKVLGLDIVFPEPQKPTYEPAPGTPATRPAGDGAHPGPFIPVRHDEMLGATLRRLNCALVPVSLPFERRAKPTDLQVALRAELNRDLNAPEARLVERLRARGFDDADLPEQVGREYLEAWRAEMSIAIRREVRAAPVDRELVKQRLLRLDKSDVVLEGRFNELYDKALSAAQVLRFSRPIPPDFPALFAADLRHLPVPPIARAAAHTANIAYPRFRDGVVRAVPLFVKHDDRMYPQMGLAMACAQLGVDLSELRFTPDSVVIPGRDGRGDRVIPHRVYRSAELGENIATFIDIPWWGGARWEYMYDHPEHKLPASHLSVVALWDLVLTRRKMAANARQADPALISLLAVGDAAAGERYAGALPPAEDYAARRRVYDEAMAKVKADQTEEFIRSVPAADLDEQSRRFLAAYDLLPELMREYAAQDHRLRDGREMMRKRIEGRSVFVGWTATGVSADFIPTSLHAQCPGVVVHGAIFNGIMTGELWRTLPNWVTYLVTAVLGVCMTIAAAFLTPARALFVAACLIAGYGALNGVVLFDYGNLVLGAAGPLIAVAGVWQGCTLIRLVVERYQRSRIEGRFRSYVDPALVDYVVENPDQVKLEGQVREMTVCFTDLGNFTPLTARLKEATVPLLNRIFGAMVPEIRKNSGYVNKFLGDGLMFFFGAPRENPGHARDALRTILDIQDAMRAINAELVGQGLPQITLRAGVNTGSMVVGDAGSEQASDYTVLGDNVNLASRMESANKQLGTNMLVSARTVELAGVEDDDAHGGGVLLRPVGQICVVGREEPVAAYEVMCRASEATDEQRRLADLTRYMVDAFRDRRLSDCLRAAGDVDREFGASKLTALYRDRCEFYMARPDTADFDCTITLAEK